MKKINLNSITYVLLHIIIGVFVLVVAIDILIIINDIIGNNTLVEKIDEKIDKIFTHGSN